MGPHDSISNALPLIAFCENTFRFVEDAIWWVYRFDCCGRPWTEKGQAKMSCHLATPTTLHLAIWLHMATVKLLHPPRLGVMVEGGTSNWQ